MTYSLVLSAVVLAIACGKKDDGGGGAPAATPAPVAATPTSCTQAGYLNDSRYGCIPIGACQTSNGPGYASYNNTCVLVQVANVGVPNQGACAAGSLNSQYGCLPQGSCMQGSAMYNGACIYVGINNNFSGNGYSYQNGYFYPNYGGNYGGSYGGSYSGYYNGYNQSYYGNPYYGYPYGGGVSGGYYFRAGVWVRY